MHRAMAGPVLRTVSRLSRVPLKSRSLPTRSGRNAGSGSFGRTSSRTLSMYSSVFRLVTAWQPLVSPVFSASVMDLQKR